MSSAPVSARRSFKPFLTIWIGQTISLLGSGLTGFALSVWVFTQTGNATPIALTALSQWVPRILLAPVAGIAADRYRRKIVMIVADSAAAFATAIGAALVFSGNLQIWHIYLIAAMIGTAGAFQQPAMTASVTMLVDKDQFSRAAGMQQTSHAIEAIATPVIAGILMPVIGLFGIVVIDISTFLIGVSTIAVTRIPQPKRTASDSDDEPKGIHAAIYGLKFIAQRRGLLAMMIFFAIINFVANLSTVVLPPLVLSIADATGLGMVQMIAGLGMLIGSVLVSVWGGPKRKMIAVFAAIAISGVGLTVTGLVPSVWTIAVGMFLMLLPIPVANGPATAIWQTKVRPEVQGQVFAARGMISTAMMPLAFLLAGPLADRVFEPLMADSPPALLIALVGTGIGRGYGVMLSVSGILLVAVTVAFFCYRPLRRVEIDLPDVAIEEEQGDETEEAGVIAPPPSVVKG
jgi:MFS family permease